MLKEMMIPIETFNKSMPKELIILIETFKKSMSKELMMPYETFKKGLLNWDYKVKYIFRKILTLV